MVDAAHPGRTTAVGSDPCPLRNGHDLQLGYTLFRFLQGDIPALASAAHRELGLVDESVTIG
jgi:hypothetical protein